MDEVHSGFWIHESIQLSWYRSIHLYLKLAPRASSWGVKQRRSDQVKPGGTVEDTIDVNGERAWLILITYVQI